MCVCVFVSVYLCILSRKILFDIRINNYQTRLFLNTGFEYNLLPWKQLPNYSEQGRNSFSWYISYEVEYAGVRVDPASAAADTPPPPLQATAPQDSGFMSMDSSSVDLYLLSQQ